MKIKNFSLLGKSILITLGFILCVLKWMGIMSGADIHEIWYCVGFAYGVGFGTIDFNICHDSWTKSKGENE